MLPDQIRTIQLEITSYCNAKCPHCARFTDEGDLHPDLVLEHLDLDLMIKNLQLNQLPNLKRVELKGDKGDPLMHPDIEKLIAALASLETRPVIEVNTNGGTRSPAWWSRLAKKNYQNLQLVFSIDGLQDTNHLYRVGVDFERVMSNAKSFIDAGGNAVWRFMKFGHNQHQINEIVQTSKSMGFAATMISSCHVSRFQGQELWLVKTDPDSQHFISPPTSTNEELVVHRPDIHLEYARFPSNGLICPSLRQGLIYVNYQGYVVPCCMMHHDTSLRYPGTKRFDQLCQGIDNQSLKIYNLLEVLDHTLFQKELPRSLREGDWHPTCAKSCRSQILENLKEAK